MNKVKFSEEQVSQLIDSWKRAGDGSLEKKLIEDIFLVTGNRWPVAPGSTVARYGVYGIGKAAQV